MNKFEYKIDYDCKDEDLNYLGKEGWELITIVFKKYKYTSDTIIFYFKRVIKKI